MYTEKIRSKLSWLLFTVILSSSPTFSIAQPEPCEDPDQPCTPIDGNISLLLAAGISYGIKKIYRFQKLKDRL